LWSRRGPNGTQVYDRWPHFFYGLQRGDFHEVRAQIRRGDKLLDQPEMTATLDNSWPLVERGLILRGDLQLQKADTMMQALTFGLDRTASFIKQMYLNLASLVRGRISADTIGGPIELASQTFAAADDPYILLLWLGMISLNLAVVNFLPIPVLDGGHMVFLIYEGLRGRRPSETVQAVATYAGLAVILSLMVFVFYLDIKRRILGM
jgi:regulator of sigma E protease